MKNEIEKIASKFLEESEDAEKIADQMELDCDDEARYWRGVQTAYYTAWARLDDALYEEKKKNEMNRITDEEEVYNMHYDSAGNFHWTGTKSGEHIVYANTQIMQSMVTGKKYDLAKREYAIEDFEKEERKMKEFNYLKEKARMLTAMGCRENNLCIDCNKCPFYCLCNGYRIACVDFEMSHPNEATEIVREWAEEHPHKTRKEVLLEKFPNAVLNKKAAPVCAQKAWD